MMHRTLPAALLLVTLALCIFWRTVPPGPLPPEEMRPARIIQELKAGVEADAHARFELR
jgi:hypothetical protein